MEKILDQLPQKIIHPEEKAGMLEAKSEVWQSFKCLNFTDTKKYVGYVLCNRCSKPLKHDKALSGTSHLKNHLLHCKDKSVKKTQQKVTGYFKKQSARPEKCQG